VPQFVQEERMLFGEALFEVVALQQSGDADIGGYPDELGQADLIHPFTVEADFGELGIEELGNLPRVGLGVTRDLLAGKRLAKLGAPGRVADHCREIADQKNNGVALALEIAQLVECDRMAEMEVGRGRVHAELYP
jgi:hypothetical protein